METGQARLNRLNEQPGREGMSIAVVVKLCMKYEARVVRVALALRSFCAYYNICRAHDHKSASGSSYG